MSFSRITASLTVEETAQDHIVAALQTLLDSFAIQRIAVFDSDITCTTVSKVENAEQVRQETDET